MARVGIIKDHIENLLSYLQPLLPLANFHMVDYFSKNAYNTFLSEEIIQEIRACGTQQVINCIFNEDYTNLPHLQEFANKSKYFTLKNCPKVCLNVHDFYDKLTEWECKDPSKLKLNVFMNSKKSHEVEVMSYICAAVNSVSSTSHLVDIGDGKGYLSSMLALHHGIPVLGIDASKVNTSGAVKRVQKLSKHWKGIVKIEETTDAKKDLYKQITRFIDENVNISELVSNVFLEQPKYLGLIGLHTCGNLAPDSLRIFVNTDEINSICNVGCCYHFLSERFDDAATDTGKNFGFPMSQYLMSKKVFIGRSARMISAQSIERILNKKELPNDTIFYRALFEIVLDKSCSHIPKGERQVGRFKKRVLNFVQYVREASRRLNVEIDLEDEDLQHIYDEYEHKKTELDLFYLIRGMLAPIIESLILLDRLLFLQENGIENSFLVQLFDPVISPRCYGMISVKF